MAPHTKKRKPNNDNEKVDENATIQEAWESLKGRVNYYKSMAEFAEKNKNDDELYEVYAAVYCKNASMENRFCVPTDFQHFTIHREASTGSITAISDEDEDGLEGAVLNKVMAVQAFAWKGFDTVIMGEVTDEYCEVIAIPDGLDVEGAASTKKTKDFHTETMTVYAPKSNVHVYAPRAKIVELLSLDHLVPSQAITALRALNTLAQKEDVSDLDISKLVDLKAIETVLKEEGALTAKQNFLKCLQASVIASLDEEKKVEAFIQSPSYRLAECLGFRVPHVGPVFNRSNNKPAQTQTLESVGEDDSILMATNTVSFKEYVSIAGDIGKLPVYVDSDQIGARSSGKWRQITAKVTVPAQHLIPILEAISDSNKKEGRSDPEPAQPSKTLLNLTRIELD